MVVEERLNAGKNECSLSRLPRGVGDTTFFSSAPGFYRSTVEVCYISLGDQSTPDHAHILGTGAQSKKGTTPTRVRAHTRIRTHTRSPNSKPTEHSNPCACIKTIKIMHVHQASTRLATQFRPLDASTQPLKACP